MENISSIQISRPFLSVHLSTCSCCLKMFVLLIQREMIIDFVIFFYTKPRQFYFIALIELNHQYGYIDIIL